MSLNTIPDVTVHNCTLREPPCRLPPGTGYWLGRWQTEVATSTVCDPENGLPLWDVASTGTRDVDEALMHLSAARWDAWPLWQRREVLSKAAELVEQHRLGAVTINDSSDFRIDSMPFCAGDRSGIGREGGRYAVESMSEPKVIGIRRHNQQAV